MYPNYYEMEWQAKSKLRETIEKSRIGIELRKDRRRKGQERSERPAAMPQLRRSGTPC